MKILDQNGNELNEADLDLSAGRLEQDEIQIECPAVDAVEGSGHYETIAAYPNGGKDVKWTWDREPVEGVTAHTEPEAILRYILYTAEELKATQLAQYEAQYKAAGESLLDALDSILSCTSLTTFITTLATLRSTYSGALASRAELRASITALVNEIGG